ncbi:MAG: glutathione S-transferase [Solirubrobacteraceae bacterium]
MTVLWHIPVSHFSEKVRWALDYKDVAHDRKAPPPGPHMAFALLLTRGAVNTLPVLQLDGRGIGDSAAILAALEERHPDPPLYPQDPDDHRRALELQAFFDTGLGPAARHLAFHHLRRDPDAVAAFAAEQMPGPLARIGPVRKAGGALASVFAGARYGVGADTAADAVGATVRAAFDRLESELDGGDHLVGGRFSAADLTAASLFGPIVLPPEGPAVPPPTAGLEAFRATVRDRPGYAWVQQTFARHRGIARRP